VRRDVLPFAVDVCLGPELERAQVVLYRAGLLSPLAPSARTLRRQGRGQRLLRVGLASEIFTRGRLEATHFFREREFLSEELFV
jgi:hypothetical protein